MNNFELLCSMGADTDTLVHWIKTRSLGEELNVPVAVYAALIAEMGVEMHARRHKDIPTLYYRNCKITISENMDFI